MIAGVITGAAVLRHPVLIARLYGVRVLWRCLTVLATGQRMTFLEIIWEG